MAREFWYHSTYGERPMSRTSSASCPLDRGEGGYGGRGPVHEDPELGVVEPRRGADGHHVGIEADIKLSAPWRTSSSSRSRLNGAKTAGRSSRASSRKPTSTLPKTTSPSSTAPTRSTTTTRPRDFPTAHPKVSSSAGRSSMACAAFPSEATASSTISSCTRACVPSRPRRWAATICASTKPPCGRSGPGDVNYEQPLHRDTNHSLVPSRMEPGFWHLEGFLYLSDVDEDCAPPRLVPRSRVREGMTRRGDVRTRDRGRRASGDRSSPTL